ncbi:MAG: helix-turn-helix domain-containing protein [Egibacteraceae bacterium]
MVGPAEGGVALLKEEFGRELRRLREAANLTQKALARRASYHRVSITQVEQGRQDLSRQFVVQVKAALDAQGQLLAIYEQIDAARSRQHQRADDRGCTTPVLKVDRPDDRRDGDHRLVDEDNTIADELEAVEFARRIEASDVSRSTLERLEIIVNDLCRCYANTPPAELLPAIRPYRRYLARLLDGKATLGQHRHMLVISGWLYLLIATVLEDLGERRAAMASVDTAYQLGQEADHSDFMAWAFEIFAWQALLDGRHSDAVEFTQVGQELTGKVTAVAAQLTAQEARAWARMQKRQQTYATLERAGLVVGGLQEPEQPDHHFVFDPRKLISYTATTLAWLGDDERAEEYAREVVQNYSSGGSKPRRLATAHIDLGLVVAQQDRPEEACHLGTLALESGRLVPSNIWRVAELDRALAQRYSSLQQVREFHGRYLEVRSRITRGADPGSLA